MKSTEPKKPSILSILFVRLRFLFVFVIIGVVVANWDWLLNVTDRWMRPARNEAGPASDTEWYCPMHPSIVRSTEAKCPTCGMPLSKRKRGEKEELPSGVSARLKLTPFRIAQAGLATEEVRYRPLVRELRAFGLIEYDERRITDLSARIAGRIEELFVNFRGTRVRAGDPLYKIYSPDLVTTQEEYLLAMKTLDEIAAQPQHDREGRNRATRLAESARMRLRLWGITDAQVAELERTRKVQTQLTIHSPASGVIYKKDIHAGHYVQVGEDSYTLADDAVVWMQAEVFERDFTILREGLGVEIRSDAYGEAFFGTVSYVQPEVDLTTRTVKVRVDVENKDGKLKPGMYVTASFKVPLGKMEEAPATEAPPPRSEPQPGTTTTPADPARTVYVCEMHKAVAFDKPGKCELCSGMELEPLPVPKGFRLVYTCPDHPDVESEKPGKCSKDGKELEFKVVPEPVQASIVYACPLHPGHTSQEPGKCPEDGRDLKLYRRENVLSVSASAIVDAGTRKTVFLEAFPGVYDAVDVDVGPRAGDYHHVLRGLKPGDRVVTHGAFLLDAEARLKPGASASYFGASGHEAHR